MAKVCSTIIFRKIYGENIRVEDEMCDDWKEKLADQTEKYELGGIFNVDEPDRTFLSMYT